ncbi:MAG TPA: hypothetical protein VGS79_14575, partial [Puia sp.]|nr:hypothetical protein [Puia sp.]
MPIPSSLTAYIRAGKDVFALKLMATIYTSDPNQTEWAICFGVRQAPPAGVAVGTVRDGANDIKIPFGFNHPLWLLPVSDTATAEALWMRSSRSSAGQRQLPRIGIGGVFIRNRRPEQAQDQEDGDWSGYQFWYADQPDWTTDPLLYLGNQATLTGLSDKGDWYDWDVNGVTTAAWLTTANITDAERVFLFSAPGCQLVTPDGTSAQHMVWMGLTTDLDGTRGDCPCLAICQVQDKDSTAAACVIRWDKAKRIDYWFDVAAAPANPNTEAMLLAKQWTRPQALLKQHDDADDGQISTGILDDFAEGFVDQHLKQWLILERIKDGQIVRNYLIPAFFRHYILYKGGSLYALLGVSHNADDPQVIHTFQV